MIELLQKLENEKNLSREEWIAVFDGRNANSLEYLEARARAITDEFFGKSVYIRGLIEFSNYCRNDCYYCGIRCSNAKAGRYRLSSEDILDCCRRGYDLGFRTFVLQSGEDAFYTDEDIAKIISSIKTAYPDCAITLSAGEHSRESYRKYFDAGADRYLLRHETADSHHYRILHPENLSLDHRMHCLWTLKKIGYQVGSGFMVGSPGQTSGTLAEDMLFISRLQPHMVGIGPFIPHRNTPFANEKGGTEELTLYCIGLLRLLLPEGLIPATTALGTISPDGREKGILAGANVLMPNLSPASARDKYQLYNDKICTAEEPAEYMHRLRHRLQKIGYRAVISRGDHPSSKTR